MIDNPNFRAFWYGTNKLMANMIFFGNLIQMGTVETAGKYYASQWGSLPFFLAMGALLAWRPLGLAGMFRR